MTCERVRAQITAYLGGELDETSASSLRGHLRLCADCRQIAGDHARVVDALASLPPPEPPRAMWDGIKARLGAAEIEDAKRSRVALWWQRFRPQLVPALGLAAAAAVAGLWIEHRLARAPADSDGTAPLAPSIARRDPPPVAPAHVTPPAPGAIVDVVEDLAGDDARADASYRAAADELIAMASDARRTDAWPAAQAHAFDGRLSALQAAVAHAALGAPRERAWQALIDYVQRAVVDGVRVAEAP